MVLLRCCSYLIFYSPCLACILALHIWACEHAYFCCGPLKVDLNCNDFLGSCTCFEQNELFLIVDVKSLGVCFSVLDTSDILL